MQVAMQTRLSQQQVMGPQLLQSIRILRLSVQELEQEIRSALERNLMLEAEDGASDESDGPAAADALDRFEDGAADRWASRASDPAGDWEADLPQPSTAPVRVAVLEQFALCCRDARELDAAIRIVDHVDDCGYLGTPLDRICAEEGLDPALAERVLWQLQRLEPAGFAARSLSECLYVQLESLPAATPGRALAIRIVNDFLDLLASHDHRRLARRLGATPEQVRMAESLILSLDARPGVQGPPEHEIVVRPEVRVRRHGAQWRVELVGRARLRVNETYARAVEQDGGCAELRRQLDEARWLVRGVQVREQTLLRVTEAIFERQRDFLERGEVGLRPLTLHEVADAIGMHESTVSRITTNKYVQTPRGTFELKHFFSSRVGSGELSGAAVRAMVRQLIEREDARRPLADGTIAALLARRGVRVARRTVAKYREAMQIAPARLRRRAPEPGGVHG